MPYSKEGNRRGVRRRARLTVCALFMLGGITLHGQPLRFRMMCAYHTGRLSAILILKTEEGGMLKGSMINEFGVNLAEFTVKNQKAKIVRLHPMLKQPFLKRILKRDFVLLTDCLYGETYEEKVWSQKGGMHKASCIKYRDKETCLLSLQLAHQRLPLTIELHQL